MTGTGLRIRMEGARPAFGPRARWVLSIMAEGLGREARFTDGPADIVYAPRPPAADEGACWIPLQDTAQAFFEGLRLRSRSTTRSGTRG